MKLFVCLLIFLISHPVVADGFRELPLRLYGKVLNVDTGTRHQLFNGELTVTLTREASPLESVNFTTSLGPRGTDGAFSYAIEIPQQYLPSPDERSDRIAVSSTREHYVLSTITLDGVPASPLDPELSILSTSFAERGKEVRLDLQVTLDFVDSDGDGMPDWWETLHALNPNFAGDATLDGDQDSWNNRYEFLNGTNPRVSNDTPTVLTRTVTTPVGGRSGLYLSIYDANTLPGDLRVRLENAAAGFSLCEGARLLDVGDSFTYADILAGNIMLVADAGVEDASLAFSLIDETGAATAEPFQLTIDVFSPATQNISRPAVWLDAGTIGTVGPVGTWEDLSPANRDAYQPVAVSRPEFDDSVTGEVRFGEGTYLYLDERDLDLSTYTAFVSFRIDSFGIADQTLFNSSDLNLYVSGNHDSAYPQSLQLKENNRIVHGPVVSTNTVTPLTISKDDNQTLLHQANGSLSFSQTTPDSLAPAFFTLGARQRFADAAVNRFFEGGLYEIILFSSLLEPQLQARIEDYQNSRWGELLIWDYSASTLPLQLTGNPSFRNTLQGGWGNDTLTGSDNEDVLRGGPGVDIMTGGASADVFQVFKNYGDDVVTDFDVSEGDRVDLSPLFSRNSGLPTDFIHLRLDVVSDGVSLPRVDTVIELDEDGNGTVNQTLRLLNTVFSDADLPWLVGGGHISMGGPRYDTTILQAAGSLTLVETEEPRAFTVTRSGNIDAEIEVTLGFSGTATIDEDYRVSGADGSGMTRTVHFGRGQTSAQIFITPVQDVFTESEVIEVAIYPSALITGSIEGTDLAIDLDDAPVVTIASTVAYAERLGSVPGEILVTRTGNLDQTLELLLTFDGTAVNGIDFEPVPSSITFAAGEATNVIQIIPAVDAPDKSQPKVVTVSVAPNTSVYLLRNPWTASVMILDQVNGTPTSYTSWLSQVPFPYNVSGPNAGDMDSIDLFAEYVFGLDPTMTNDLADAKVTTSFSGEGFILEASALAGMNDIRIYPEFYQNQMNWTDATDLFEHRLVELGDGRVRHLFEPRDPQLDFESLAWFRVAFEPVPIQSLESDLDALLGTGNQSFLTSGTTSGWIPLRDGNELAASPRASGETSHLITSVVGPRSVSFEWEVVSGSGATLTFEVDGAVLETLSDGDGTASVSRTVSGDTAHELRWSIAYGDSIDPSLTEHALIRFISIVD